MRRRDRSHDAIVQAVYDLVRAHHVPPTMEEVAREAGVGTRTVFRLFSDMERLHRSMNERVLAEVVALAAPAAITGVLEDDLAALVATRARVFEHITPFRRAGRVVRHASPFLQQQDTAMTQALRARVVAVLAPHLDAPSGDTLEALDAWLSFETWDRLRSAQRLDVAHAERVLVGAASTLARAALPASPRRAKR